MAAQPGVPFQAGTLTAHGSEVLIADLDGDGLKDLIVMDNLVLSIFYQDPQRGFSGEPDLSYHLEARPCLVWTAKLGGPGESLLVLDSGGVNEISFAARNGSPALRRIIRQATLAPASAGQTNAFHFPLSVQTHPARATHRRSRGGESSAALASEWPLLLVPTGAGLQVWQHGEDWRQVQILTNVLDAVLWPSLLNPGYSALLDCDLSIGDVNHDGREDLMVRRPTLGFTNFYSLFLQQTNGLLGPEPAMSYADRVERYSWLCWADLNHDGRVDLLKSVWLNEPSFIPGVPSGKVLVSTYLADEQGRIPAQAQQRWRKNDWMPALPVVDVDGDGYLDLVLGYSQIDSREGLRKQITARQIDYSLRFFCYRPGTGFPTEADFQRSVVIRLDHAEFDLDWSLPQNFRRRVQVSGDFTGEGKAALMVRDQREEISVYYFRSRAQGFSSAPDLRFNCPEPIAEWQTVDLNGDGISDVIVTLANHAGLRVFLSRK